MMQGVLHIGTHKKASFRIIEYGGLPFFHLLALDQSVFHTIQYISVDHTSLHAVQQLA